MFPSSKVKALDFYGSDHRAIYVYLSRQKMSVNHPKRGRFFFEGKWMFEETFHQDLIMEWSSIRHFKDLPNKLRACKSYLQQWADCRFDKLAKKIKSLRNERLNLLDKGLPADISFDLPSLDKEIEKLMEMHWKQRGRVNWLKHGDRNTTFFHSQAQPAVKRISLKDSMMIEVVGSLRILSWRISFMIILWVYLSLHSPLW